MHAPKRMVRVLSEENYRDRLTMRHRDLVCSHVKARHAPPPRLLFLLFNRIPLHHSPFSNITTVVPSIINRCQHLAMFLIHNSTSPILCIDLRLFKTARMSKWWCRSPLQHFVGKKTANLPWTPLAGLHTTPPMLLIVAAQLSLSQHIEILKPFYLIPRVFGTLHPDRSELARSHTAPTTFYCLATKMQLLLRSLAK